MAHVLAPPTSVEVAARPRGRAAAPVVALGLAVAATAVVVRVRLVAGGGGLGGTYGYDDGVYYSAAASLLAGRLPYRDFLLLHPPGIVLALAPFALLGRVTRDHVGFEATRVAWILLGALNATLVFRVCRRAGLVAATAGGMFYALWASVARTETNAKLEPLVTLWLLVALALLARDRGDLPRRVLLAAGAALALAVSVKIWAAAPALLVLVWVGRRAGARAAGWAITGALSAGVLVNAPFLLVATARMPRMVVLDQLGRGRSPVDAAARLAHVLLPDASVPAQWSPGAATVLLALGATALVVTALVGSARGRFALCFLAVQLLVLVLSPSFFGYYAAFAGPALALVAALLVGRVLEVLPTRALPGTAVAMATVVVVGLLALDVPSAPPRPMGAPFPAAALRRAAGAGRCVTSDSPDALLLTDLFSRDLRRGCRLQVDLSGLTYDRDALPLMTDGTSISRSANSRWQRDLGAYLFSGRRIFLLRPHADGQDGSAVRRLLQLPVLRTGPGYALLDNGSAPDGVRDRQASATRSA